MLPRQQHRLLSSSKVSDSVSTQSLDTRPGSDRHSSPSTWIPVLVTEHRCFIAPGSHLQWHAIAETSEQINRGFRSVLFLLLFKVCICTCIFYSCQNNITSYLIYSLVSWLVVFLYNLLQSLVLGCWPLLFACFSAISSFLNICFYAPLLLRIRCSSTT